jgi:hypothetical protein
MALAHLASALLTVMVWSLTARALDALAVLPREDAAHFARPRRTVWAAASGNGLRSTWPDDAPRRGPPIASSPSCA